MVECSLKQYPGVFYELKIKGHAGYNPGNDIVCSAVSALAYTFFFANAEIGINSIQMSDNPGDYYCYIDTKKLDIKLQDKAQTIFSTIYTGLKHIAAEYPDNVKVTFENYNRVKVE